MRVNIFELFTPAAVVPFFKGGDSKRWSGIYGYGSGALAFGSDWVIGGTATASPDGTGNWRRHACTTAAPGGYRTNSIDWMRKQWSPTLWIRIKADAVVANMRLWAGFWSTSSLNSDDPAGAHLAAFRYSSGIGSALRFCTKDGVTLNAINAVVLFEPDLYYDFKIIMIDAGKVYWEVTREDMMHASGNTELNLPGNSTMLGGGFFCWATTGTVYYKSLYAHCEHR